MRENRRDRIVQNVADNWARRMPRMVERLKGGEDPPFQERVTPAKLDHLIGAALSGNVAAEALLHETVANAFTLEEQMRGPK